MLIQYKEYSLSGKHLLYYITMDKIINTIGKIEQLITYVTHDMMEPAGYLPLGLITGILFLAVLYIFRKLGLLQTKKSGIRSDLLLFLVIVYVAVLLKLAFFSREPGSRTTVDLTLFGTWGTTMQAHAFFVENIIMFIPFGILIPSAFPMMRNIFVCTLTALACSLSLEMFQLITGRGFCQLDDVVTNTLGALIGCIVYKIWTSAHRLMAGTSCSSR